jgi:hypothetical protein
MKRIVNFREVSIRCLYVLRAAARTGQLLAAVQEKPSPAPAKTTGVATQQPVNRNLFADIGRRQKVQERRLRGITVIAMADVKRRSMLCSLFLVCSLPQSAETLPCGIAVVRAEGPKVDERFVPAPPERVKVAVVKALPALAMKVHKDKGLSIEAETDRGLQDSVAEKNRDAGIRGANAGLAWGSMKIEITPATQEGQSGSRLRIEFDKPSILGRATNHGNDAQPLADESACLVKILSFNDLSANPRGLPLERPGPTKTVALLEATPVKIQLPELLDSRNLHTQEKGESIQFEVAEDVIVDGAVVIRKGALAKGHFTNIEKARANRRHAELDFAFDTVTTIDGQNIPIAESGEKARGGRHNETAQSIFALGPVLSLLNKGVDVLIRAGTGYDVETAGEHVIQAGR